MQGLTRFHQNYDVTDVMQEDRLLRALVVILAARMVGQLHRDVDAKGVALAVDVEHGAVAKTDPEMIVLVMQNLVGNAVKYSSKGTVRIAATGGQTGKPRPSVLSVADEGPGITPEEKERVFEAFRRGEAHGQEGVGLGLAVARRRRSCSARR